MAAFSHFLIPSSVVKFSEYNVVTISDDKHNLFYIIMYYIIYHIHYINVNIILVTFI